MRLIVLLLILLQQCSSKNLTCTKEYIKEQYKANNFNVIECNCDCTMQNNIFFIEEKDASITYQVSEVSSVMPSNPKKNMSMATKYFVKDNIYCNTELNLKNDTLYFFTLIPFNDKYCYELSAYMKNNKVKILKDYVQVRSYAKIEVLKSILYELPNSFSKKVGYLLKNDVIEIIKEQNNWLYIVYNEERKIYAWVRKEDIVEPNCNSSLREIEKTLKQKIDLKTYDKEFFQNLLPEKPIEKKTLTPYNNIAYYLQKAGSNKEAVYLLEKILKEYPNRTVAHYNLADAYWALGDKKKAVASYKTYIEQMKAKGKEKRIPKVVKNRVSSK